jgi:Uma2 family endonuclease
MTTVERWTTADLARFPDNDGLRYEIINGELHVTKAPHSYHQVVAGRIAARLDDWAIATGNGLAIAAPGIIISEENNLIPDAVWISNERLAAALGPDGKLHELPELIVEVLSPGTANMRRDREEKLDVYARHDVQEYWIVDWPQRIFEVYHRDSQNTLQLIATLGEGDALRSSLFMGFELAIASLFVGVPRGE